MLAFVASVLLVVALAILLGSVRSDHLESNVSALLNGVSSHGKGHLKDSIRLDGHGLPKRNSTGRDPELEDLLKRRKGQAENWRPGPCG